MRCSTHINSGLQEDWRRFGPDAFTCQVLEEKPSEEAADVRWELKQMEARWLDKRQPYGERGYNKPRK